MLSRQTWLQVREATGADATLLLDNTSHNTDWDSMPADRWKTIPDSWTGFYLGFIGDSDTDPDGNQATVRIWLYFRDGPAMFLGQYTVTIGKQKVNRFPWPYGTLTTTAKYADTLAPAVGSPVWLQSVSIINSGNDQLALLKTNGSGAERILVEVTAVSSGLTVTPIMSGHEVD